MNGMLDPCGKFPRLTTDQAENAAGILPYWAGLAYEYGNSMKKALMENYAYYWGEMKGGEVKDDGAYHYPGDPILYPLVKFWHDDIPEVMYVYQHSIVAVVNAETGERWVTRMD